MKNEKKDDGMRLDIVVKLPLGSTYGRFVGGRVEGRWPWQVTLDERSSYPAIAQSEEPSS